MKHSILCVDDESDNVDALERLFRRKYRVLKATSGEDAIELLAQNPVAAIITDQRMPGMTGVELLERSLDLRPDAIRILLTGYADIESVVSAINSGRVYRYVTKPWDPVDLGNAVDKAVERWEIGAELASKNKELRAALDELRGLDEAKTNFMLLVNHELKTPLTSLLSFGELLAETKLDSDQAKYLDRVTTSAKRLQSIVADTLEFVSAETGHMKLEIKARKAKALFTQPPIDDLVAPLLEARKLSLEFAIEDGRIEADERAMRNVFRRLLHNAAKFADKGTSIRIEGRDGATNDSGLEGYRLTIRNRAPDIDKRKLKEILKPFALNENALNHSTGTGMGLSICQALLRLHGSSLEITSLKGEVSISFLIPSDR